MSSMPDRPDNSAADHPAPPLDAGLENEWPLIARILDANANRAEEGLRVLEDCFRFGRDDPFLSGQLKQLRHQLAEALQHLPRQDFLLARDTQGDVGTTIIASGEYDRSSLAEIIEANMRRVQHHSVVSRNTASRSPRTWPTGWSRYVIKVMTFTGRWPRANEGGSGWWIPAWS